jgi:uncharacterized protein (TIGR02147 family)
VSVQVEKFRRLLQDELVRRCNANPRYSLRSFARSLAVDYSVLSKIIRGERKPGMRAVTSLSEKLGLSPSEISELILTEQKKAADDDSVSSDYRQIQEDTFRILSDWYYFAILELTHIDGFSADPRWIGQRLGLTVNEVNIAIERLLRVNLLKKGPRGKLTDNSAGKTTTLDTKSTAAVHRDFQKRILTKALQAMDEVQPELRDQSSMTFAVSQKKITGAKDKIKKFRRELAEYLRSGDSHDEVYCLSVSLFPMTQSQLKH